MNYNTFSSRMASVITYECSSRPNTLAVVSAPTAFSGKMGVPVKPNWQNFLNFFFRFFWASPN